jgi:glycosyltransferase involved in cell wall biosynthesis
MTRLLHLIGRPPDLQTERTLRAVRRRSAGGHDHVTRSIGLGGEYANLFWAVVGLRRDLGAFDVVHAWDERAMLAAACAGARRIVFTPPPALARGAVDRLRLAMRYRDVHVVCSTLAQQDHLVRHGIAAARCRVIRPPVDAPDAPVARDAALRRALGIGDDDFVLLAPGESTRPAAHERAAWAGSILHVVDERFRVLLWGRGEQLRRAATLGRKLRQPALVTVAEHALGRPAAFDELLAAADALLVTARGRVSPLPVGLAMAAGVPVVSAETPLIRELSAGHPVALVARDDTPRSLAQCVLELRADPSLRQRLAVPARAAARGLFDPGRGAEQFWELYASCGAAARIATPTRAHAGSTLGGWGAPTLGRTQLNAEDI